MLTKLKEARIQAGYSIKDVAKNLYIKEHYLVALENNDLEELPGKAYASGYLKLYAKYLGVREDMNEVAAENSSNLIVNEEVKEDKPPKYRLLLSLIMLVATIIVYEKIHNNSSKHDTELFE